MFTPRIALTVLFACDGKTVVPPEPAIEQAPPPPQPPGLSIDAEQFVLGNGLTVIVHEDHKAPIVAVNVWYHVGSKDEPAGRSGFAHLFEHLMFQGSDNFEGEYFEALEPIGATDLNGTTNEDRTNYFETVPTSALDLTLWMESDRMGHFVDSITQELLDEQREVVKNEKRQGLNQPYGAVWDLMPAHTYPKGHPYSHSVIGSMDDLDAATLEDVKEWFTTWYGPSNAVLVLAGDITPEIAREKAERYFGDIAPGPALSRPAPWTAPMDAPRRLAIADEVPVARLYRVFNVPEYLSGDERRLQLATRVLGEGKNSRLHQRLVYNDELATQVSTFTATAELGSQVVIIATARKGVALSDLEAALDEELARLRTDGITDAEIARARMQYFSGAVYGSERVGGFGGKSDRLARSAVLGGSIDAWQQGDATLRTATAAEVGATAAKWLTDNAFTLEVHPTASFGDATSPTDTAPRAASPEGDRTGPEMTLEVRTQELTARAEGADRSALPPTGDPSDLRLPPLQRTTLDNGLTVVLAERHEVPVVRASLVLDAGYAADPPDRPGLASMAMTMIDEGTEALSALSLDGRLEDLGASLRASASIDTVSIRIDTLKTTLQPSLDLFSDVVRRPAFQAEELERQRKVVLARIDQERSQPTAMASRLLGPDAVRRRPRLRRPPDRHRHARGPWPR